MNNQLLGPRSESHTSKLPQVEVHCVPTAKEQKGCNQENIDDWTRSPLKMKRTSVQGPLWLVLLSWTQRTGHTLRMGSQPVVFLNLQWSQRYQICQCLQPEFPYCFGRNCGKGPSLRISTPCRQNLPWSPPAQQKYNLQVLGTISTT